MIRKDKISDTIVTKAHSLHLRILLYALLASMNAHAQERDSVITIGEVEVVAKARPGALRTDTRGNITMSASDIKAGVRSGGFADAIKILTYMPGFSSVSDYSSGISVNGAAYNQIGYEYAGAPVFFPYHFGGIFSTFNTNHLSSVSVDKSGTSFASTDRIGGRISINPIEQSPRQPSGTAEVGMLASAATIKMPFGLSVSGRVSYIDAIYSRLLNTSRYKINYDLADFNITYSHPIGESDRVDVNVLGNFDRLHYLEYDYTININWHNLLASARWSHADRLSCLLYISTFGSEMGCILPQMSIKAPSWIIQGGTQIVYSLPHHISLGWRTEVTRLKPQTPILSQSLEDFSPQPSDTLSTSIYNRLSAEYRRKLSRQLELDANAAIGLYEKGILPLASVSLTHGGGSHSRSLTVMLSSQHLYQIGMSDLGMATNFWIAARGDIKPVKAYDIDIATRDFWLGGLLATTAEAYIKRVLDEPEYTAGMLDFITGDYSLGNYVKEYNGYNAGISAMVKTNTHPVNGRLSVDAGLSRRRYEDGHYHPSPYQQTWAVNAFVGWEAMRSLDVSLSFSAHSGRPYTGIDALYIFGGNVIAEYGVKNGSRMPTYHRLDLSCNYFLPPIKAGSRRLRHFLNLSVHNIYGRKNTEMQYFRFDNETNEIYLRRQYSLYRFMPSISYTLDF